MSGGYFDHKQYHIEDIIDSIETELNNQGKEKPKEKLFCSNEYYEKYPEEKYYQTYPDLVQEKMREAVRQLKIALVYVRRIDWFLSGDDGEDSFLRRLSEDLKNVSFDTAPKEV